MGMVDRRLDQEELREIVSRVRDGTFPYEEKAAKEIDFTKYNRAQANEIADVLEMIRNVVDTAFGRLTKKETGSPGQPPKPINDVVKVLLMQSYFGVSNRVAEGFARLFRLDFPI